MLSSVEIKEGATSKRSVEYEIATGEFIPNLGEKKFQAVSQDFVDAEHHCRGTRSKQGSDEREEGDAGLATKWCLTRRRT